MKRNNSKIKLLYPLKETEYKIINGTKPALLKLKESCGEIRQLGWTNKLIYGDNLTVLKTLYNDENIQGNIRLVYIDPPFATGRIFDQNDDMTRFNEEVYSDTILGHEYTEFLRKRLVLLRELLAKNGSIYVHLDQRMTPYIKILMDEIFGENNFRNWITRKKCHPKGYTKNSYGNIQDFILFYSKTNNYVWNKPLEKMTKETIKSSEYRYIEKETGRIYKKVPIHAPGTRNGKTGIAWRGKLPPQGKHWQYLPDKLDEFDRQGKIYWSPTGNPRLKIYLDERKGTLIQDIWLNFPDPINQFTSETNYPTEKNQKMLERIIATSSREGDIVLDCFAGSGTTLIAAEKLNRRWIGVDNSKIAIQTSKKRFLDYSGKNKVPLKQFDICEI